MRKNNKDKEYVVFEGEFCLSARVINGEQKYFIKYFGVIADIEVEIDFDTYSLYKGTFSKPLKKLKNEKDRRIDFRDLEQVLKEGMGIDTEEICDIKFEMAFVWSILQTCTYTQRRRFILYHIYGYTYKEIAIMENCKISTIAESVKCVVKKINEKSKEI